MDMMQASSTKNDQGGGITKPQIALEIQNGEAGASI
jgi:hypothetical protein